MTHVTTAHDDRTARSRIRTAEKAVAKAQTALDKAQTGLHAAESVAEAADDARRHPLRTFLLAAVFAGLVFGLVKMVRGSD